MKRLKTLLLAGLSLTLLVGCKNDTDTQQTPKTFESLEIKDYPKTVFYCGEEFSNSGISLTVKFSDGTSFVTEDVTTSKPSSMKTPGKQTIKAYYSNDEYDINDYVTYEITIIDWTRQEKAIFDQTTLSSVSGVYYPKMEGMQVVVEGDPTTGEVTDYYIKLENATTKDLDNYLDLLNEYCVTKKMVENGQAIEVKFRFFVQNNVPSDFVDLYGDEMHDAICYRYSASYEYIDTQYGSGIYEFYANQAEDTLVIGFDDNHNMIVRFILNSVLLENAFYLEVNQKCDYDTYLNGTALESLSHYLFGTDEVDEETNETIHYVGLVQTIAPLAVDDFILPELEPEIMAVCNYGSANPWLHGEDDLCFGIDLYTNDEEALEEFISKLNSNGSFTKGTRSERFKNKEVDVTTYTIDNKDYVGDLKIEVSEFVPSCGTFTKRNDDGSTSKVTTGCFRVYYTFVAPEIVSPSEPELHRIYDFYYGEGAYSRNDYAFDENGNAVGTIRISSKVVDSKEAAMEKFVNDVLTSYHCMTEAHEEQNAAAGTILVAEYINEDYKITIYSYFAGSGKYAIEFKIQKNMIN